MFRPKFRYEWQVQKTPSPLKLLGTNSMYFECRNFEEAVIKISRRRLRTKKKYIFCGQELPNSENQCGHVCGLVTAVIDTPDMESRMSAFSIYAVCKLRN